MRVADALTPKKPTWTSLEGTRERRKAYFRVGGVKVWRAGVLRRSDLVEVLEEVRIVIVRWCRVREACLVQMQHSQVHLSERLEKTMEGLEHRLQTVHFPVSLGETPTKSEAARLLSGVGVNPSLQGEAVKPSHVLLLGLVEVLEEHRYARHRR